MEKNFDILVAAKKWCKENGHDGFYCTVSGESCGCTVDDLCPCGVEDSLYNGDCAGGKLAHGKFFDANGVPCDSAIVPHDYEENNNRKTGDLLYALNQMYETGDLVPEKITDAIINGHLPHIIIERTK